MHEQRKVQSITGTITLADGTVSEFSLGTDGGWQQWGAQRERLGRSVDVLEAIAQALLAEELVVSDPDPDDED